MKDYIYLDHAATTPMRDEVLASMLPYLKEEYGNASSLHARGQATANAISIARQTIADAINAKPSEIYFTSGGTEADAWAVRGLAYANMQKGKHIITSAVEHHAVLHNFEQLAKEGFEVTYIAVDKQGMIDAKDVEKAIRKDTTFISIMAANSEVGSIMPIAKIGEIAKKHAVLLHTDAVQAAPALDIDVVAQNITSMSLSAHKMYGPKGIGALYIKNGTRMQKFMLGGGQERNQRAGTSNTPAIVGFAKAFALAKENRATDNKRIAKLRDMLVQKITTQIKDTQLNGPTGDKRLPNNANISFARIEGESILMMLDFEGVGVSTGSACSSGSLEPSHVLLAMQVPLALAHGSIRFTLGKDTTEKDIDTTVEKLSLVVEKLRAMSPIK